MRVIHSVLLLFLLAVASGSGQVSVRAGSARSQAPQASQSATVATDDEYEVWSEALRDVVEGNQPPRAIVIRNETKVAEGAYDLQNVLQTRAWESVHGKRAEEWRALQSELSDETIANFEQRNDSITLLSNRFRTALPTILITHEEEVELSAKSPRHFWEAFHQKYADAIGVFTISRVGFNSNRTQAVVYVAYRSGEEGGDGRYVLLQRKDGAWVRQRSAIAWMS